MEFKTSTKIDKWVKMHEEECKTHATGGDTMSLVSIDGEVTE